MSSRIFYLLKLIEHGIVAVVLYKAYKTIRRMGLKDYLVSNIINTVNNTSFGKNLIGKELESAMKDIEDLVVHSSKDLEGFERIRRLPAKGMDKEDIMELLHTLRGLDKSYHEGKAFGGIYSDLEDHHHIQLEAGNLFHDTNALYPFLFLGVKKLENEFVDMTLGLLDAPETGVGIMTTGGTESIIMAVMAYREWGRARGITEPEMICPVSAHAAFCKGAHYLGVKFICVPVDSNYQVSLSEIRNAITPNTIMIVGSAPTYPNGVIDNIEAIGEIALRNGIPFHVDSCLGAYILPFLTKLGHVTQKWNYQVPGVTSISADLHKYGHGLKGISTITYVSDEYRKFQFFTTGHWTGGLYASPSFTGSRSGMVIAAAWTCLVSQGEEGYMKIAERIHDQFVRTIEGIKAIPELEICGSPDACCISFTSSKFDVFLLPDLMEEKNGWKNINRMQRPNLLQIQVGARSDFNLDQWLEDLRECSSELAKGGKVSGGSAAIYGLAGSIPSDTGIIDNILTHFLSKVYS